MTTDPVLDVNDNNLSPIDREHSVLRGMPSARLEGRGSSMRRFVSVSQDTWHRGGFRVAASLHKDAEQ